MVSAHLRQEALQLTFHVLLLLCGCEAILAVASKEELWSQAQAQ